MRFLRFGGRNSSLPLRRKAEEAAGERRLLVDDPPNPEPTEYPEFSGTPLRFTYGNTSCELGNSTYTVPPFTDELKSDANGRWMDASLLSRKTSKTYAVAQQRKSSGRAYHWDVVKMAGNVVESAADGIAARINRAFEGRDAVEIGNRFSDLLPSVRLPSIYSLGLVVDSSVDVVQRLVERWQPQTNVDIDTEGSRWEFALMMSKKAQRALVRQGICEDWQTLPTHANHQWQYELNEALRRVYELFEDAAHVDSDPDGEDSQDVANSWPTYRMAQLLQMEPLWIADESRMAWRLELDTLVEKVDLYGDEAESIPIHLQTDFCLMEKCGCLAMKDCCRGSKAAGDEWELVD